MLTYRKPMELIGASLSVPEKERLLRVDAFLPQENI
jgi:hypothetical protein